MTYSIESMSFLNVTLSRCHRRSTLILFLILINNLLIVSDSISSCWGLLFLYCWFGWLNCLLSSYMGLKSLFLFVLNEFIAHDLSWCSIHHAVSHSYSLWACCGPCECSPLIVSVGLFFFSSVWFIHNMTLSRIKILWSAVTRCSTKHSSPLTLPSTILAKHIPIRNISRMKNKGLALRLYREKIKILYIIMFLLFKFKFASLAWT